MPEQERQELKRLFLRGVQPRSVRGILSNNPELQQFCDELLTRQTSWTESKRSNVYLLNPERIKRLEDSTELLIAMLEDRAFRDFWDASQRKIQQRATRRSVAMRIGALAFLGLLLLAITIGSRSLPEIHSLLWDYAVAVTAGMLGAGLSSLNSVVAYGETESPLQAIAFWVNGGLPGAMIPTLALSGVLEISLFRTTMWPTNLVLLAFLAGFASRLVSNRLESVVAVLGDKRGER